MYLDYPQKIADTAEISGHRDVSELVNFIKEVGWRAECPRNNPTTESCYSMSNIPDLTVCEEYYHEVIAPQRQTGTGLSTYFTGPRAQPVEFTCQLYSPRMRGVWEQANAPNDINYLRQTVSMRRIKEREIMPQLERLKQVWEQQKRQVDYYVQAARQQQSLADVRLMASVAAGWRHVVSSLLSPLFPGRVDARSKAYLTADSRTIRARIQCGVKPPSRLVRRIRQNWRSKCWKTSGNRDGSDFTSSPPEPEVERSNQLLKIRSR